MDAKVSAVVVVVVAMPQVLVGVAAVAHVVVYSISSTGSQQLVYGQAGIVFPSR